MSSERYIFIGDSSWFDSWDVNVYVSAIRYGQLGNIFLHNNYTTVFHSDTIFYPLYTVLGFFLRNIDPYLLFQIFSVLCGMLLSFTIFSLAKIFLEKKPCLALFLVSIGGGLGWISPFSYLFPDISITGFTFYSAYQRPHEALALVFYLFSLGLFFKYRKNMRIKISLIIILSCLLQIFFYPYLLLSFFLITSFYLLIIEHGKVFTKDFFFLFCTGLIVLPVSLWYFMTLKGNPGFDLVYQVKLPPPSVWQIVFGYGVLFLIFVDQLWFANKKPNVIFLNVWFVVSLLLTFLPFGFSRFFLKTLFSPLVFLSVLFIPDLSRQIKIKKNIIVFALIVLVSLTSLSVFYSRIKMVTSYHGRFFVSKEQKDALNFIQKNKYQNIISLYSIGNLIPANTNKRVYFGHFLQTPNGSEKLLKARKFYQNKLSETEAEKFIKDNKINLVYFGIEEKNQFNSSVPFGLKYKFLTKIYENSQVKLFAFINHENK